MSTDRWIKEMWYAKEYYLCAKEYYSAIKKSEVMPFAATWKDLKMIIVSKVRKRKTNTRWYHVCVEPKIWHQSTYLGVPSVVQRDWWHLCSTSMQVPFLAQHGGIWHCCSCGVGRNCGSELIPGLGTPYAVRWPKNQTKQTESHCISTETNSQIHRTDLWLPWGCGRRVVEDREFGIRRGKSLYRKDKRHAPTV